MGIRGGSVINRSLDISGVCPVHLMPHILFGFMSIAWKVARIISIYIMEEIKETVLAMKNNACLKKDGVVPADQQKQKRPSVDAALNVLKKLMRSRFVEAIHIAGDLLP